MYTKKQLEQYRDGGEGMTKWVEDNVHLPIMHSRTLVTHWVRVGELPDKKIKSTGRSYWEMWCNEKEDLKEALQMIDGDFLYKLIVYCWMRGEGKCQEKGSKVLMYDGTIKKVEDVEVGDFLMGDDNTPRKVLSLASGKEEMFKVIPNRGRPLVVTGDHKLSLVDKENEKDVIDISVEDYQKQDNFFKDKYALFRVSIDWPEQEVPVDSYFFGLCLGLIIDSLLDASCFANKDFLNFLEEHDLVNKKHIPHVYKANSRSVRLEVLAGLIDAIGHKNGNGFQFSVRDKNSSDDILFLARSLGFDVQVESNGLFYVIDIFGDCSSIPISIDRKKSFARSDWKDVLVSNIKEIKSVGEREYYGFNLDGNGRYVTGDFTVTHNSLIVVLIQMWKFFNFPRQQIVLGANSKDQSKFVHYDLMKDVIFNSPNLIRIVGKRNIQEKSIVLKNPRGEVQSAIRSISSYSGIVSNITGYTFSEMFDMKDPKFFVQLDGSTRNVPLALGTIDSTVSTKDHVLYRLYKSYVKGDDPLLYFSYRSSPKGDYKDFWHPRMDQRQLDSFKSKFPPAEFERYFKNTWELSTGKLFTPEVVNLVHCIGIDHETGFTTPVANKMMRVYKKILSLEGELEKLDGRKKSAQEETEWKPAKSKRTADGRMLKAKRSKGRAGNKNTGARLSKRTKRKNDRLTLLNEIDYHKDRFITVDTLYDLHSNGLPRMLPHEKLIELGKKFDTNWAIETGLDRSDPLATTKSARTILTCTAKGALGSKSKISFDENNVEYIRILLHLAYIQDASLKGIKDELQTIHDEYDGIDTFCSERWGVWDLQEWCEEMDIHFEAIFPSYTIQKAAFSELYQASARGKFKAPTVYVQGSVEGDILSEEMSSFDYDPKRKWYGSPQKEDPNGIQDDAMFSLAWCLYGGRDLGIDDFRDIQPMKEMFGIFYSTKKEDNRSMVA